VWHPRLSTLHARTTGVKPAVSTLPDEPKGAAVADLAPPLDQGVVRLDHDERVRTMAGERHLVCRPESLFSRVDALEIEGCAKLRPV
jgi:hypothetical protein